MANRLLEKGIISSIKKNNIIHFIAADPERLKNFLQQKELELQKEKKLIDNLLPSLLQKYKKTEDQTDIEVFYGWEGMKTTFNDIIKSLNKGDFNYVFGASQGHDSKQADIFFSQYYKKKITKIQCFS